MPLSRKLMRCRRVQMPLRTKGPPLLLGRYNHTSAQAELPDHNHRDTMEICFLVRGCQTYRVGARSYRLRGGDIFLTLPNEGHSSGGLPEEKGVLYWLQLPLCREEFLGLPKQQSAMLFRSLLAVRHRHFRGSWKMKEHLDAITSLYHEKHDPLGRCAITNHVGAFLLKVAFCARKASAHGTPRPLQPVLRYIEENLGEPLPVPRLAALAGLSVARFKARFKEEIGIPPGEYVARARIAEAQTRLKKGHASVTEIAYELGFSSSQYFATVFKRFTGSVPSDHRVH